MSSEVDALQYGPSAAPISIRVGGLYKCYQVYAKPHDRLKQALLPRLRRLLGQAPSRHYDEFWALCGVDFEVRRGETVGIIGRNGSGKSTLLQIVCGTLTPTAGQVEVHGRVAALLELGSGFNPEFTGRENVYLYGGVLGLQRQQIQAKFAAIEAFADIGDFIDQPVKTYSSGMVVRLAFAVIAHVEADILVIDEALAVGDAAFTQKCMRFLRTFKRTGTILFVSHDTGSILNLCDRAIWLHGGQMRLQGDARTVSKAYLEFTAQEVYGDAVKLRALGGGAAEPVPGAGLAPDPALPADPGTRVELFENIAHSDGWETGAARIESVALLDASGQPHGAFQGGERVVLRIRAATCAPLASPIIGFFVKDRLGQSLFGEHTFTYRPGMAVEAGGVLEAEFHFRLPMLPNGTYSMTVSIADGDPASHVQHHWLHDAVLIQVASDRQRYGLVGIAFERVRLEPASDD